MMHFPIPFTRSPVATEPPTLGRAVSGIDAQWNRPVFKAPPLAVSAPLQAVTSMVVEFARDPRFVR